MSAEDAAFAAYMRQNFPGAALPREPAPSSTPPAAGTPPVPAAPAARPAPPEPLSAEDAELVDRYTARHFGVEPPHGR